MKTYILAEQDIERLKDKLITEDFEIDRWAETLITKESCDKLYNICLNNTEELVRTEWNLYNDFLEEMDISVLPDNYYKEGKSLNYGEVQKMYNEWLKSREKKWE